MFREKNLYPGNFFRPKPQFYPDNGTYIGFGRFLSGQMEGTSEKSVFSSEIPIFLVLQRSGAVVYTVYINSQQYFSRSPPSPT
jgi:hypothetical protein